MSEQKRPAPETLPTFDDPADTVNAVISTLQKPEKPTNVALTFANEKNVATEVQAYAKIAGRSWTYYVKTLAVSIGRNTDVVPDQSTPQQQQHVHIDLGPAKVVSRQHAAITYNIDLRCWELKVLGRNGARIDGSKLPVGAQHATPLHSGAIFDVGGTQMMFILPDTPPSIDSKMLTSCLARYNPETHKRPRFASHAHRKLAAEMGVHAMRGNGFQSMSRFQMFEKGSLAHSPSIVSAVSLQNNLDQDLSCEDSKDIKPPYLYATMITQAILSNPDGVMSLSEIYKWISSRYAYYKYSKTGWQNSIRHNLSLNKAFEKVPRRPNEPGKGMKWQISDSYRNDFMKKMQTGTLLKSRRGSSVSRTLQIHLATHQGLPETKTYVKSNPAGNGGAPLEQRQLHTMNQMAPAPNMMAKGNQQSNQQVSYASVAVNHMDLAYDMQNEYQVRYGHPNYQQRPVICGQANQQQQQHHQPQEHHQQQQQQYQQQEPQHLNLQPPQSEMRTERTSPMRHSSIDSNNVKNAIHGNDHSNQYGMQEPQKGPNMKAGASSSSSASSAGVNLFKVAFMHPKVESSTVERNGPSTSFANTSHVPNTSESMIQNLTAPTISNTSELGISFTSPKKIVPLEAFTPERGLKSTSNGGRSGAFANTNQSSPAFWNFVQFSTPNEQTPGRKNSDESNGQDSPTLARGVGERKA